MRLLYLMDTKYILPLLCMFYRSTGPMELSCYHGVIGSREKPGSLSDRGKHILENVLMNIGNFILESDVGNVHVGNLPLVSSNCYSVIGFRHIISIF